MSQPKPLYEFEVVWKNGHVERFHASQMLHEGTMAYLGFGGTQEERYVFHGEFDGSWIAVLNVLAADIATVRNVTLTEQLG